MIAPTNSEELLQFLAEQHELLAEGNWEQAYEREQGVDLERCLAEFGPYSETMHALLLAEIETIASLAAKSRDEARAETEKLAVHRRHLRTLSKTGGRTAGSYIDRAS